LSVFVRETGSGEGAGGGCGPPFAQVRRRNGGIIYGNLYRLQKRMGTKIYFVQNDVCLGGRGIIWRRKKGRKKFWIYSNKLEYYYFLMEK
jgi:hypothetical protein